MRLNTHSNTKRDYERSRALRSAASPVEKRLWQALSPAAAARGLKFRRQQIVHPYVADFACMQARLLIELDGASHDHTQSYDERRSNFLQDNRFEILRFTNDDVIKNTEGVVMIILSKAEQLILTRAILSLLSPPLPNPPREGEGIAV